MEDLLGYSITELETLKKELSHKYGIFQLTILHSVRDVLKGTVLLIIVRWRKSGKLCFRFLNK